MKNSQKKYSVCLILISYFFTTIIDTKDELAAYNNLSASKRWEHRNRARQENPENLAPKQTPKNPTTSTVQDSMLASLPIAHIALGMGIGILCTIAWNYYANPSQHNKDKRAQDDDCDVDTHDISSETRLHKKR